jgi:hypothetical protein
MARSGVALGFALALLSAAAPVVGQTKQVVHSMDDLPQYSYPVPGTVADVLTEPSAKFETTVAPIRADIAKVLAGYDIADHATMRALLSARLGAEIASGTEDQKALATIAAIRALQDKEDARLTSGLAPQAFLEARIAGGGPPGACPRDFGSFYKRHLDSLPWTVVGTTEIRLKGLAQVATPTFVVGLVAPEIQPALDRTHALSSMPAWQLMAARVNVDVISACREPIVAVTDDFIRAHAAPKVDIWASREATFPTDAKLTPVRVAIWDSGFDTALFPGQLMLDASGRPMSGPTYDVEYRPTTGALAPLTPRDKSAYPEIVADSNAISDLQSGIDSPAAAEFRKHIAGMSNAQMQSLMEEVGALISYMHGTHVAGLAAKGNPAIRMVSARVTYDPKPVPTPPTDQIQRQIAAAYAETVAWFRAHDIRVVNMSWWNRPSNYAADLEKNGIGKTAEERKALARHYFTIERDGLRAALASAPDILFVTIAGNNDSDNAFEETIPSSFQLPNLLVVGAVDQAGEQTNFTSTGQNIAVYADGYQVESVVPGGAKVRMSGTSMAAPEVTNLAAKLLAINPHLSPEQIIAIIKKSADPGEAPAIRRIDPKLALATVVAMPK